MMGLAGFCVLAIVIILVRSPQVSPEIPGYVEKREVALGFLVPGRVQELCVDEGQSVQSSQPLARLDPALYHYEAEQSQADVRDKEAQLQLALKDLDRQKNLQLSQTNTPRDYDQAVSVASRAQAAFDLAVARQDEAHYRLQQTTLFSPSDGVITRRLLEPGSLVSSNPVFSLTLIDPVWIRAYATAEQLRYCNPGTWVKICAEEHKVYVGQIGYISPQAEFTPKTIHTPELRPNLVYRLRVVVQDPLAGELRQGIPVTLTLPQSS